MAEVAALGLRVDGADGIDRASSSLDRLSESSDTAEKSSSRLTRALSRAGKDSASAGSGMAKAGRDAASGAVGVDKLKKAMDGAKSSAASLQGALTGAFIGVSVAGVVGKIITETQNAEQEQAQLAAALRSTGNAAGFTRDQLNQMAAAMESASTASAGEINQAQTALLAFTGIAGTQFTAALQAAIDMSARTGMSVVSAAETIGRALDVPSQGLAALSRQGFRFSDDQKELAERLESTGRAAEAQGIVLSALQESYGGAAAAARDTFGGSIAGLRNALSGLTTGEEGSLDGAKDAVNDLTGALSDPDTVAAFSTIIGWVAQLSKVLVESTANMVAFLSSTNKLAIITGTDEYGSLVSEAESATAHVARLSDMLDRHREALSRDPDNPKLQRNVQKTTELLIKANNEAMAASEALKAYASASTAAGAEEAPTLAPIVVTPTGGGSGSKKPKSKSAEIDEGQRYIQQLNERLALIGKETEYEQLLAKIRLGSLKFSTQAMQDEALAQAQTLDFIKEQESVFQKWEARKTKFGDTGAEADQFILGKTDPLSGGLFDNQFSRYEAEAEAERERYQGQLDRLREARELQIETGRSYDELEYEAAQQHANRMGQIDRAKTSLALASASEMFGSLTDIMRNAGKEQSGIYKAMFFAQKAAAIAQAIVNTEEGATKALAMGPFGIPMSTFIRATGYASVAAMAAQTIQGMAHDGIDSVPATGTWLLEKGERVTTAQTSAKLDSVLERIDARQRGAYASAQPAESKASKGMVVNIIENPDRAGQTETRRNENGDEEADVFVADIFGGGRRAEAIQQVFGLRRMGR